MINTKKKINKIKIKTFLKEFPIIFLLQHNNFTVNDWFDFRQKIQEINDKPLNIEILNIKNSLFKKILESSYEKSTDFSVSVNNMDLNNLKFIFQGPNFIVGCKNENHLKLISNCIKSSPKLVFISCLYKNQLLNHLDFEILLKTNSSVYNNLFFNLDKKTELYSTLYNPLNLYPLFHVQSNLINILSLIK